MADYRLCTRFIFELDTRHDLDWKQLCELPAWFTFLLGLVMWLNFAVVAGGRAMYVHTPFTFATPVLSRIAFYSQLRDLR